MYKHILLATDGSENAIRAAKEAIKIATCIDALIEIVYVADFEKSKSDVLHSSSSEALDLQRRKKIAPVEQLIRDANLTYQVKILRGIPGQEIVRYANEQQVDMVVIGSRGLNGLQEMVLGSVSHKVMKGVNCPALIVKQEHKSTYPLIRCFLLSIHLLTYRKQHDRHNDRTAILLV